MHIKKITDNKKNKKKKNVLVFKVKFKHKKVK